MTCRRWNWRQAQRTQLHDGTRAALFIVDALAPMDDAALAAVGDELEARVRELGGDVRVARRVLGVGIEA